MLAERQVGVSLVKLEAQQISHGLAWNAVLDSET